MMPSTNQMIADLVAQGFVLPEGTELSGGDLAIKGDSFTEVDTRQKFAAILLRRQLAYDLIACELARQIEARSGRDRERLGFLWYQWQFAMRTGDTEAAIKAVWEAVCGGKQ